MSNHLIDCASQVGFGPRAATRKLLLLCLADDSRDGSGRIASPGQDKAMRWTGLSRSSLFEAYTELTELGLIQQRQRGQRGLTAEWLLFPEGCCDVHRKLDRQGLPGLSGSGGPDPEQLGQSSLGPVGRTQRTAQGPVGTISGSGAPDPSPSTSPQKNNPSPQPPDRRTASPMREVEETWSKLFTDRAGLEEFCAELRTIRREQERPTTRWTAHAIRAAIAKAVAAGYDVALVPDALRAIAADRVTELPTRVAAPGPWWDLPETRDLDQRRAARTAARAAQTRRREQCDCDYGWITTTTAGRFGSGDTVQRCPKCSPTARSNGA